MQISEGEIFALVVAEKALQQYRGTSFEKPLLSALKKMEQALPDTISLNLADIEQTISFRTRVEPILDLKIFDTLAKAAAQRRQLELSYRKPGQPAEKRIVDPYHLANINGEWFLFAFDHARKDVRTFVPARIKSVTLTGRNFDRPQKFSLEKRLRDSFGVHSGQGEYEVVLRFNARAADYIREKKWHASQSLRELKGGGVELKMKLSSLAEVERWVLSWGGDAKVLKPRELAEAVRQSAAGDIKSAGLILFAPGPTCPKSGPPSAKADRIFTTPGRIFPKADPALATPDRLSPASGRLSRTPDPAAAKSDRILSRPDFTKS